MCSPPGPLDVLAVADPRIADQSATVEKLKSMFDRPFEDPWRWNLVKFAADRRLSVCILTLVLAEFYRHKRRQASTWAVAYDREALLSASRSLPSSPQAEVLLDSVKLAPREEPLFPLRLLLAATQSRSEIWACCVLHSSKEMTRRVRSVVLITSAAKQSECSAMDYLVETVQEAIRGDMTALLFELLTLNRTVVEVAAVKWASRMHEIVHSAADRRQVGFSASHRLDNTAGKAARGIVAVVERRELWECVKPIIMARHRLVQRSQGAADKNKWRGLLRPRHQRRRTTRRNDTAVQAIVALPDSLFAAILSFVAAPTRSTEDVE
jgi:hypothetical protein